MRGEVLEGVERRRRWTDEQKLKILMEVGLRGATVTDVARRHAVSRSQLYAWRRDLKRHGALRPAEVVDGGAVFVPLAPPLLPAPMAGSGPDAMTTPGAEEDADATEDAQAGSAAPAVAPAIEIVLAGGRRLCVPAGLDEAALARLIRLVEGA